MDTGKTILSNFTTQALLTFHNSNNEIGGKYVCG